MTDHLLLIDRIQHTLHGSFDIFDGLVDDLVQTYIHALSLCGCLGSRIGTDIESDDDRIGRTCQRYVGLIDGTYAAVDTFYYYFFIGQLHQGLLYCFYATLYISLDDQVQFLQITLLDLTEQIIQRHSALGLFQHLFLILCQVGLCISFCCLIIIMCQEYFTGTGNIGQTQDLYGSRRSCFLDSASLVIDHGSYLTMSHTCRDKVSHMQGTLLYQYGSHRTASLIQLCLDDQTSCLSLGVRLQLHDVCGQQDHVKQLVNTLAAFCGYRCKYGASAPILGDQLILCQLLLYTVNVCRGLIDLVHCYDDLHTRCLCMVDRLYGLGHYAVVRCYYQDSDIGRIGTTHTHGGKCFVSGSI